MGATLECTMTECGEAGARRSSSASTRACGGRAAPRPTRLLMVGASRTDSAPPPLARAPATDRSTPTRAYASKSSARTTLSVEHMFDLEIKIADSKNDYFFIA